MAQLPDTYVPGFHDENEIRKMKYRKFGNTGLLVSEVALGTGGFCQQYGAYTKEECKATLIAALKKGINYIDTAPWYGHGVSEEVLGYCLEGVPRKAYYLATKVGRYEKEPEKMFDFSARKIKESVETSLRKLKVDYLDILQVHDIEFAKSLDIIVNESIPAVKEAVDAGKARFIGVTGYPVTLLAECIKRSPINLDMVLSYTRLSLLNQDAREYLPFFESKGLGIVNAAVHCMGLLSNAGPQDWHPADDNIKSVCAEAANYCKKHNVELGRLALYYALQQMNNTGGPHTVLVGMNTRELLAANLDVAFDGLKENELAIYQDVQKILSKLKRTHWEGVSVDEYWKSLKASK